MEVLKGAVALEATDVVEAMAGIIPLIINIWCNLLVAPSAGLQFFLRG